MDETDDLVIRLCRPGCVTCKVLIQAAYERALAEVSEGPGSLDP